MTITPDTILRRTVTTDSHVTWRQVAAMHFHAALLASSGHCRQLPAEAAKAAVQHVNALAAELARTEPPAHPHRDTGPR